ncbi:hypothetical protein AX15_006708 [Amanita polypyramis BW_CC]|nr:hypothetical protein AX15_006708 [Amanita polypyramis BW_CC]
MQWYQNGTAPQYLEHQPECRRFEMVIQVARGLKYLHIDAGQIIHGDIKGNNILVSDDGYAVLGDFGLAGVVDDFAGLQQNTTALSGSLRWQAPELLAIEDDVDYNKTLESDVWAFACTAFELLDGYLPYHWFNYDYAILRAIYKGQKPVREKDARNELSGILEKQLEDCWAHKAAGRPGIGDVVQRLENIVRDS